MYSRLESDDHAQPATEARDAEEELAAGPKPASLKASGSAAVGRIIQSGEMSYYGTASDGFDKNGLDAHALTVAHKTLPIGTMVTVKSRLSEKEIEARVTDRGPYARATHDLSGKPLSAAQEKKAPLRILDGTVAVANALGYKDRGFDEVDIVKADESGAAAWAKANKGKTPTTQGE